MLSNFTAAFGPSWSVNHVKLNLVGNKNIRIPRREPEARIEIIISRFSCDHFPLLRKRAKIAVLDRAKLKEMVRFAA